MLSGSLLYLATGLHHCGYVAYAICWTGVQEGMAGMLVLMVVRLEPDAVQ